MRIAAHEPVPKTVRTKVFRFTSSLESAEGGAVVVRGEGKPNLRVTSPPEFRGEANSWSPEHLFVAAADACLYLTFAALAEKQQLAVASWRSEAEGVLEWREGSFRFTKIVLKPQIVVGDEMTALAASELLSKAHASCLIASSLSGEVVVEPAIRVS